MAAADCVPSVALFVEEVSGAGNLPRHDGGRPAPVWRPCDPGVSGAEERESEKNEKAMGIIRSGNRRFDATVPVVVIGAGACGCSAALAANERGADVLVIERDDPPAGSTSLSGGQIPAAGTKLQRSAGIEDTPEEFAAEILEKARHRTDAEMALSIARGSTVTVDWLVDTYRCAAGVVDRLPLPGSREAPHARHPQPGWRRAARLSPGGGRERRDRPPDGRGRHRPPRRRGRQGHRRAHPAPRREPRGRRLRRSRAGLQRIRRQSGNGPGAHSGDRRCPVLRSRRQSGGRREVGTRARRGRGRHGQLPGPRRGRDTPQHAYRLAIDHRGRDHGQRERQALQPREPGLFRTGHRGHPSAREVRLDDLQRARARGRHAVPPPAGVGGGRRNPGGGHVRPAGGDHGAACGCARRDPRRGQRRPRRKVCRPLRQDLR